MHDKDDPTDCDDDSNHDDFRDIVCMTRMISTVYDDDSDFEKDFWSIWRLWESILGPFCDHFALMLGHLGVLAAKISKSDRFSKFDSAHFGGFWDPITSLFEGRKPIS